MSDENKSGEQQLKFPDLLKILAAITGVAGLFMGLKIIADSNLENLVAWIYIVSGLCSFALWWSLSVIVAAAQRYIDKNRE